MQADRNPSGAFQAPVGRSPSNDLPAGERPMLLELLRIFSTRLKVLLVVVVVVMTATVVYMMKATPIYRSTCEVLIERQVPRVTSLEAPVSIDTSETDYYNTQYHILQSPGLAARVAKALNLAERKVFDDRKTVVEHLLAGLDVMWLRNNRIVDVAFHHPDRQVAADIANAFAREYALDALDRRRKAIDSLSRQMGEELTIVGTALQERETRLLEFYMKNHLLLGEERESMLEKLVEEAAMLLVRDEEELRRLEAVAEQIRSVARLRPEFREMKAEDLHRVAARELLAKFGRTELAALSGMQAVLGNSAVQYLRLDQAKAIGDLERARVDFQPGHRSLLAEESRVESLSQRLEEEIRSIATGILLQYEGQKSVTEVARAAYLKMREERAAQHRLIFEAEGIRRERDAQRNLYDTLQLRIKESEVSSNLEQTNVHILNPAEPGEKPVRPNLLLSLLTGLLISVIAGAAATVLLEKVDNTVHTPDDVEEAYALPVLSMMPEQNQLGSNVPPALVCWQDEQSAMAESVRRLRAAILLSLRSPEGGDIRKIMVCSSGAGEGKTVTAVNLAVTLAQMGTRTLLIDTDFYRSETHKLFGLDREKGLSTLLVSDIGLNHAVQPTSVPFLDMMTTGQIPPQPTSLLASTRMKWVLEEACRHYNRVVVDTSPLIAVTDGTLLAPHMDALILVVRQGTTEKPGLRRSLQTLSRIGVRPLGVAFNGVNAGLSEFYFRYRQPSYAVEQETQPVVVAPPAAEGGADERRRDESDHVTP